jgi:hypothetical protein
VSVKRRVAVAIVAVITFACVTYTLHRRGKKVQDLQAPLAQNGATLITQTELVRLLEEHYEEIHRVDDIPLNLKQSFANLLKEPFDLSNPGDLLGTDYIVPGVSSRQVAFAAVSSDTSILVYLQGGYATTTNVVVFTSRNRGSYWLARITSHPPPRDLHALEEIIAKSGYSVWVPHSTP